MDCLPGPFKTLPNFPSTPQTADPRSENNQTTWLQPPTASPRHVRHRQKSGCARHGLNVGCGRHDGIGYVLSGSSKQIQARDNFCMQRTLAISSCQKQRNSVIHGGLVWLNRFVEIARSLIAACMREGWALIRARSFYHRDSGPQAL